MSSPKNKRPTASSKSFADFPRSIPRLSRGASMFSLQNHQSCGSCGSSPRVRLMVTVISRDHSGNLLPDATGTTRHRCFRDRYLHGKFPGWGYFRRPKVDACSCDSKFFFVKRSKVAEKNDKFDIHWTSVLRIQYTSSLQAEFYSREFWLEVQNLDETPTTSLGRCMLVFAANAWHNIEGTKTSIFWAAAKKKWHKNTKLRVHDISDSWNLMNTKSLHRGLAYFKSALTSCT